jgi:sulfite reductase alpha subunit-like flavoprotein
MHLLPARRLSYHLCRIEGALDPWVERLFESLLALFPLPQGLEILPAHHLRPSRITMTSCRDITDTQHTAPQSPGTPAFATLKSNRRITSQDWYQNVRHLEFELDTPVEYVSILLLQNDVVHVTGSCQEISAGRRRSHLSRGTRGRRRPIIDPVGLGQ